MLFQELLGLIGSMRKIFGGVLSHFENSTAFCVLLCVLFPEIPRIREISRISGAGDSSVLHNSDCLKLTYKYLNWLEALKQGFEPAFIW